MKDVSHVMDAWLDEGRCPEYHRVMQDKLRREWPVLANALDNLTRSSK